MEVWKPIPGYEGLYEVSSIGRVRSLDRVSTRNGYQVRRRGRLKSASQKDRRHLHPTTKLTDRLGRPRSVQVHQLVALAFLGPRPDGLQVCHYNDDPTDNRVANLRYDTPAANVADSIRNGKNFKSQVTHCPRGHEYDAANTYVCKRGKRTCRACAAERMRQKRATV